MALAKKKTNKKALSATYPKRVDHWLSPMEEFDSKDLIPRRWMNHDTNLSRDKKKKEANVSKTTDIRLDCDES